MSIRRRSIANRLLRWLLADPREEEKYLIAKEVLNSPSKMGKYLSKLQR